MSVGGVVVDSSALVAILFREEGWEAFRDAIASARQVLISAANLLETRIVVHARLGPRGTDALEELIAKAGIQVAAVDGRLGDLAFSVHRRFGKGAGDPPVLNFGDCFSLALAELEGLPLLYKGNDFSRCGTISAV